MGDEGDRQMGAKRMRILFSRSRRADTVGGGDDRQMQGAERKSMLVARSRTKSRHEYLEGKCTA